VFTKAQFKDVAAVPLPAGFVQNVQSGPAVHSVKLFAGYGRRLPLGVKRPKHEGNHSPISSAELRSEWSNDSTRTHPFMVCTGITLAVTKTKVI
jgi:hypothetical protein